MKEVMIQRTVSSLFDPEPNQEESAVDQLTGKDVKQQLRQPDLRPQSFEDFPGQDRAVANLKVYVTAAKKRQHPLDHVLLYGPPGLGKTSLAKVIAKEMGCGFLQTSGPAIEKPGDLAGILSGLEPNSILFIDEIHRLSIYVEEILYSAMEDFEIDLMIGKGPTARSVKMPLSPFTLIGATTRVASLSRPLQSRFGIIEPFRFYDTKTLQHIIMRTTKIAGIAIEAESALELAQRSRGTPRIANRLVRRVRDFSEAHDSDCITVQDVQKALTQMEIDGLGLEPLDRTILWAMHERYNGGPVGLDTLSHTIGEDKTTIEDVIEPYLMHLGLIHRGPRGRELTPSGVEHVAMMKPSDR